MKTLFYSLIVLSFGSQVMAKESSWRCQSSWTGRSAQLKLTENYPFFEMEATFPLGISKELVVEGEGRIKENFDSSAGETTYKYLMTSGEDRVQLTVTVDGQGAVSAANLGALVPTLSTTVFAIPCQLL